MVPNPSGDGVARIASRGSELALWQARTVRDLIRAGRPDLAIEIDVIKTTGDRILDVPLARIGDRGLFTKEIDAALLDGSAHLAVHSLKDVPTRLPEGLALVAITEREDPRDVLILRDGRQAGLADLRPDERVGTSSLRRRSQLRALRPDLQILDVRGNLNTRLAKLDAGEYDALLLAAAGVVRLGWSTRISEYLDADGWLPAVGQGALAIVGRDGDPEVRSWVEPLHHPDTSVAVRAERAFLHALEGGCQIPIAALGRVTGGHLQLEGLVADIDGATILRKTLSGNASEPEALGVSVAESLLRRGAGSILEGIRRMSSAPPLAGP